MTGNQTEGGEPLKQQHFLKYYKVKVKMKMKVCHVEMLFQHRNRKTDKKYISLERFGCD